MSTSHPASLAVAQSTAHPSPQKPGGKSTPSPAPTSIAIATPTPAASTTTLASAAATKTNKSAPATAIETAGSNTATDKAEARQRWLTMFSLILAGESIFLPAFHLGRYFKSSLLTTFALDEFQLGQLGAAYGVCATICYFLGGPLADRWSPRWLMTGSLLATAAGSVYMSTFPGFTGLCCLFGFWGITTILAFWAPLISVTRQIAGTAGQGRAFGILDGGRGLASALIASAAAYAFAWMVGDATGMSLDQERLAVQRLIWSYGLFCCLAAACVWRFVPDRIDAHASTDNGPQTSDLNVWQRLGVVLSAPAIWLQAVIIIAAYSAFKMLDNYGLYAQDAYGLSTTDSAKLIANISYARVGAALAAGWIADKWLGVRGTIQVGFALLLLAYGIFLLTPASPDLVWLLSLNMLISCIGFFALRGIYFALIDDAGIPPAMTGTAVGVISFVGYAPEIFMGPLTGWLIREAREQGNVLAGYQQIFLILGCLCASGMLAAWLLRWYRVRR